MISCALHDFIEIACLYGYRVELTLNDGSRRRGVAVTTRTDPSKQEYLVFNEERGENTELNLESIRVMRALSANPHFEKVEFPEA